MSRLLPAVWSACPALLPALALASGILLAGRVRPPVGWCLLAVGAALAGVALTGRRGPRLVTLRPLGRTLLVAGALVGVGAARQALEDNTAANRPARLPLATHGSRPVLLTGRVVSPTLIADHVSTCGMAYTPGTAERAGLVTLNLAVSDAGESVSMLHQVHVDNIP